MFEGGARGRVGGCSSLRDRGGDPAGCEAEAAADAEQSAPWSEALAASNAAHSEGRPGHGATASGSKRLGISDLYQDVAPGSAGEECGCIRRVGYSAVPHIGSCRMSLYKYVLLKG